MLVMGVVPSLWLPTIEQGVRPHPQLNVRYDHVLTYVIHIQGGPR
jgi:hypothetical protein